MKPIFHTLAVLAALAILVGASQGLPSAKAGPYGAYFGIVPDTAASQGTGCALLDVRADSPAAEAGLKSGDVIVQFGEAPIGSVDDLLVAVRTQPPEQPVPVRYLRQGREQETEVILKAHW